MEVSEGDPGVESWSIRAATEADYDDIIALWEAGGLPIRPEGRESRVNFGRQLVAFPGLYLVATEADRMIGVVLGSHDLRKG